MEPKLCDECGEMDATHLCCSDCWNDNEHYECNDKISVCDKCYKRHNDEVMNLQHPIEASYE